MSRYPKRFVPDLRRLRRWPELRDTLWRSPDLVRLTYGELAGLVQALVGPPPLSVLDVGCGLGHVALELARAGHDVTGVDADEASIELAVRAAETDPLRAERGPLSYRVADFPGRFEIDRSFDRVVFSRVLHHVDQPASAVARAAGLLAPGGRVVCVEFAHDRLGPAAAGWIAGARMRLSRSGSWPHGVAASRAEETRRVAREWRSEREDEGLHPFRSLVDPLQTTFRLRRLAWHPYLFWDVVAEMRAPAHREAAVARRLRDEERELIRARRLRGVLFSTMGTVHGRPRR